MNRKGTPADGFTLLEVLISLFIIGGLLTTVLYTISYHLSIIEKHRVITTATLLAREKLSEAEGKTTPEEKGTFPPPLEDYTFVLKTLDTAQPEIEMKEVRIRKDGEEVIMRRYVLRSGM